MKKHTKRVNVSFASFTFISLRERERERERESCFIIFASMFVLLACLPFLVAYFGYDL